MQPVSPRTEQGERDYQAFKASASRIPLHLEPEIQEFNHWKIIVAKGPYNIMFKVHDLLIPKRIAATYGDLTPDEKAELQEIKEPWGYVNNNYDTVMVNMASQRSNLDHYHEHLLCFKDSREEFSL